jgi:hypothetical protein
MDDAERRALFLLADRGRLESGGSIPFDVAVSVIAQALRATPPAAGSAEHEAANLFNDLFNSPHFQVQIGGNPILVDRMLDRIDELRSALAPQPREDEA